MVCEKVAGSVERIRSLLLRLLRFNWTSSAENVVWEKCERGVSGTGTVRIMTSGVGN